MKYSHLQIIKRLDLFASCFSKINTLDEMIDHIEKILEEIFSAEHTGLYLFDPAENRLKLFYARGLGPDEFNVADETAMDRHPGKVYHSGEMYYVPDTLQNPAENTNLTDRSFRVRSRLYLPVTNGEQIVGAFGIVDSKPNAYDEDDIALLSFICNMAGSLYTNILNKDELKKLATVARASSNAIGIANRYGEIEWINEAFTQLFEYTLEELKGSIPGHFLAGEETDNDALLRITQAINNQAPIWENLASYSKSGRKFWIKLRLQPVFDSNNNLDKYIIIHIDVTKEREAELELLKRDLFFSKMMANIGDVIVILDANTVFKYISPNVGNLSGLPAKELIGSNLPVHIHPKDQQKFNDFWIKLLSLPGTSEVLKFRYLTNGGSQKWIEFMAVNLLHDKEIDGIIGNFHDITLRQRSDELVHKITQALEQSPVMTFITDSSGIIEYVNPKMIEVTGYSEDDLKGQNPRIIGSAEKTREEYAEIWNEIGLGKEWRGEFRNKKKNGELYWVMASISPVFDSNGVLTNFIAVEEDISQRKLNEHALKISNLRFQSLISSMQDGVLVEDEERKVVLANQYFCKLFDIPVPPEQLIGMDCSDAAETSKHFFHDPDIFIRDIDNTLSIGQIVTGHELQMINGTTLERDFIPIRNNENETKGILWIYRNVTSRKRTEKDLKRQSQILNGTAEAMNFLLTLNNHTEAIQKALETIGLATGVDRVYIFENEQDSLTGESFFSQRFEWVAKGIEPQIDNPELQNMPYSSSYPRWYNLLLAGETVSGWSKDFPENERKILESEDIISIIVAPIFVRGHLWGMVGFDDCTIGTDWSDNEISILTALASSIGGSIARRLIETDLIQARHIAEYATKTKSEFLATMSHEIRTPMNGVIGMTSLLMETSLAPDQKDYVQTIKLSGELLLNLINDILDFSKVESGKLVLEEHNFNLRMAVEDVIDLLSVAATEKKLDLLYEIDPQIPEIITGDLTRLRQILVNLAGNAIKFTSKGEVIIRVRQLEIAGTHANLEFQVADTGIGIPENKIHLLFQPFSQVDASTTRKFGGTGLGLAICAKLADLMHGKIKVESKVNHGSTFSFSIKTSYHNTEDQSTEILFAKEKINSKTILLVDSNSKSRSILCSLIKSFKGTVLCAESIPSAIELINVSPKIDLVLVDNFFAKQESDLKIIDSVKQNSEKDIPVVLMAYPALSEDPVQLEAYFSHRINKPLKHSQLISLSANLLAGQLKSKNPLAVQPKQLEKINDLYPLNILVAEDNTINQKLIVRLFEMLGYSIHLAANGLEVIEALTRLQIDIIFMDIQMPEMDGVKATRQIISQWGDSRPLIIAMTANALHTDKEMCINAGMDDYISKPLTIVQVKEGMEKWAMMINDKIK